MSTITAKDGTTIYFKRLEHAMDTFEQPMTTHRIGTGGRGSLENFRARRRAFALCRHNFTINLHHFSFCSPDYISDREFPGATKL